MTKTWVMADEVPASSKDYLIEGKWYEVDVDYTDLGGEIVGDDKEIAYISFKCSSHIGDRDWNVYYGDTPPNNHLESSTISLESSTSDFKWVGDTRVAGDVENVSNQFLELLKDLKEGEFYHPSDLTDFIEGLESGKYTILYNKDLTK